MRPGTCFVILSAVWLAASLPARASAHQEPAPPVSLVRATIVTSQDLSLQEQTAVRVLVEEVERRTAIRLPVATAWPQGEVPVIAVGTWDTAASWAGSARGAATRGSRPGPEGFRLRVEHLTGNRQAVLVVGADARGLLYGIGKLLREAVMERGYAGRARRTLRRFDASGAAARPSAGISPEDQRL